MSGLGLTVGGYGGGTLGSGYNGALPTAANNPSSTISQQAFGITTGGAGRSTAANGSLATGAAAALLLAWLWWSLPR